MGGKKQILYRRRFINAALAAGAIEVFQETKPYEKRKFYNKNFLAVFNNSGELLEIHLNDRQADGDVDAVTFQVAPSASPVVLIEPEDGIWFQWASVENLDGAVTSAAGEIIVEMRKVSGDEITESIE